MPFHAAQVVHGHRRASGMWDGSWTVLPTPRPQLQHLSSSNSLRCPQTRQSQSPRRATVRDDWRRPQAKPAKHDRKTATAAIAIESMGERRVVPGPN